MFKKEALQDGDKCIDRTGEEYIVFRGWLNPENPYRYRIENDYKDDLTHLLNKDLDIMTVIRNGEVVFKRKENEYYMHSMHKNNDGLTKYYNNKQKLLEDISKLIDNKDLILLEVVKCNTN